MNTMRSFEDIIKSFRNGNDQKYIYSHVLPLFVPKTPLFEKFNSNLKSEFLSALAEAAIDEPDRIHRWETISNIISDGFKSNTELNKIEESLLSFYRPLLKPERTIINQTVRNDRCFNMVKDYLIGNSILDYGCGKGLLGAKIKSDLNKEVFLVDNIDFNKSELQLLYSDRDGNTSLPDKLVDTSIAYLVLHHMDNPFSGLQELARLTKNRIVLMEGFIEKEEYRHINQAIDWFFNRILLGVDMNVPLNFLSLNDWSTLIEQVGFKVSKTEYVGADEKLAPEHHVLIIADRV